MATPATRTPIKLARGSYSNLYASIDDLQEGEIVYAEDQNQLYVKEGSQLIDVTGDGGGGSGSTNLSYTTSGAGLSLVSSSGSNTNLPAATTDAWGLMTDEDKTKLDNIILDEDDMASDSATKAPSQQSVKAYVASSGSAANLSNTANGTSLTIESSTGNNTALPAATTSAWGVMTDEDKTNLDANTAKVTNATHTGDVTGSGALTIADDAVTYAKMQNVSATDRVLGRDSSGAGVVEEITPTNLRAMINVEDGATGDQSNAEIRAAVEAASDSNVFTDADHTKLNGIEASATADQTGAEIKSAYEGESDTNAFTDALLSKLNAIEASATADQTDAEIRAAVEAASDSNVFTDADHSKLNGIAASANNYSHPNHSGEVTSSSDGATTIASNIVDEDNLKISNSPSDGKFLQYKDSTDELTWAVPTDTNTTYSVGDGGLTQNNFTNTLKTKLDGIEASATADQTNAEIRAAVEAASDSNVFTDDDHSKLNGIAAGAEVNVQSDWNASSGDAQILNKPTIPTNTDTTYAISCVDGDNSDEEKIRLTAGGSGSGTDDVVLEAGTGLSIARSGDKITFTNTVTDTNTQLSTEEVQDIAGPLVATGGTKTGISVTYDDANGNMDFVVAAQTPEGTAILSTGETGGSKYLREDGDGTCSWQAVSGGGGASTGDLFVKATNSSNAAADDGTNLKCGNDAGSSLASGDEKNIFIGYEAGKLTTDSKNTFIGNEAANSYTQGSYGQNTFIGNEVAPAFTTGTLNTGVGVKAGGSLTTGQRNCFFGNVTGGPTTGSYNTLIGNKASTEATGDYNTALGHEASATHGDNNTSIGNGASADSSLGDNQVTIGNTSVEHFRIPGLNFHLKDSTATEDYVLTVDANGQCGWEAAAGGGTSTGETYVKLKDDTASASNTGNNTYAGSSAGNAIASGAAENTLYGYNSGLVLSTADRCTIVGSDAGKAVTTANNTTVFGHDAGKAIVDGGANTCLGNAAGQSITTGAMNVTAGNSAGNGITTGSSNIIIGQASAGSLSTGSDNTVIGTSAGVSSASSNCLVLGNDASATNDASNEITLGDTNITSFRIPGLNFDLKDTTATEDYVLTVDANGKCGWEAAAGGGLSSDAQLNTVGGSNAGDSFTGTDAEKNTLIGYNAGTAITEGDHNTAVGNDALKSCTTGNNNTAIGHVAGDAITTGVQNTLLGEESGTGITTGSYNTFSGTNSGKAVTEGDYNCYYGNGSGLVATDGDHNTGIGRRALYSLTTGSNNATLGSNSGNTLTTGSNNVVLGYDAESSAADVSNEVTLGNSNISSLRCQVQTISSLSDERDKTDITSLDLGLDFIDSLRPVKFKWDSREGITKDGTIEAGFIAQDFQKAQKDNDADYLGLVYDKNPDRLEASYGKLVPVLVKAIQELKQEIQTLKQNG